jgi:nucleoid DNA-binding protein
MQQYILPFLAQHYSLTIKDLGTFSVVEDAPSWEAVKQQFTTPETIIKFSNTAEETTEEFINFIATKNKLTIKVANEYIQNAIELFQSDYTNNKFIINGIGTLQKKGARELELHQSFTNQYKPITAVKVIRQDAKHTLRVGETETTNLQMQEYYEQGISKKTIGWFTIALLLSIATIGYILFYFFQHKVA